MIVPKGKIVVSWWGKYSSGGNEGDNPHHAYVSENASDSEIRRYITNELLPGTTDEDYGSEHWRGVGFRRLTEEETRNYVLKTTRNRVGAMLHLIDEVDPLDLVNILTEFKREGTGRLRRMEMWHAVLKGILEN